jgi:2-keto-4-pentenoate hydratase
MDTSSNAEALALRLRESERTRQTIAPLRDDERFAGLNNAADAAQLAYTVQQLNVAARVAAGERIVGRKIGLTSPAVQHQLGVDQPDFGALFASMAYGDNQPIALGELIQPKVEAEIALVLEHDLTHERHTYADLIRATAYAVAAIEVVDSRIEGWNIRFVDTVADNASSARFVLGSRPACAMTLSSDTEVLSRGNGFACLGNPLNAAAWLADRMVQLGTPLRAGDVLMTGALGPMVTVTQAGTFSAQIDGLGSVRATFSASASTRLGT